MPAHATQQLHLPLLMQNPLSLVSCSCSVFAVFMFAVFLVGGGIDTQWKRRQL